MVKSKEEFLVNQTFCRTFAKLKEKMIQKHCYYEQN